MKSNRYRKIEIVLMAIALPLLLAGAIAGIAQADKGGVSSLHRLVADFQNNTSVGGTGEIFTTATPLPAGMGGTVTYTKSVTIPDNTVFITFSGQADAHFGSALLMSASVTDSTGAVTVCEPLAGQTGPGGGGTHLQTGWYTCCTCLTPASPTWPIAMTVAAGPLIVTTTRSISHAARR